MRLRNWLLTSTSIAALLVLPTVAQAQEAEFRALLEAQQSGDADAMSAAEQAFNDACAAAGFGSMDACMAAIQGGDTTVAPIEEPRVEEPALPEEPQAEQPAAEEPAPEQPAVEEPLPEQPAAEEPQAEEPAPEQPAMEAPATEEPSAEEPAPEQELVPVEEPVPAEEPAPAEPPAAEQPAEPDPMQAAIEQLQKAAEVYQVGVDQLDAGDSAGQSTIEAANAQFAELCAALGFADVAQCLAEFGIELPPLPATPVEPKPSEGKPISELPGADNTVLPETTEVLPEDVTGEAAPILDSAKDILDGSADPGQPGTEQPEEPAAPPPENDQAAQSDIAPVDVQSLNSEQGDKFDAEALPTVEVPQNVIVINNVTNVNVVNNTTVINNDGSAPRPPRPVDDTPNYTNSGFIFQIGVNLVFSNPASDFDRISDDDEDFVYYERLSNGRVKETVERPNGVQIVTIRNRYGEVLKRSRITPDGREYILAYYDDSADEDDFFTWRDPGDDLPPLRLTIAVRDYILDADEADEDEVELFFRKPPVEQIRKIYSIDDVKRSARLRDSVRRIEVGGLTFDSGKATIARDQIGALSKVANAMLAMLEDNPAETFLIEGHTDAVGSDQANLVLSDSRAATVARILTDFYDVPPENLTTQGYGERYLKVKTDDAERLNRRVSIKRITPLITVSDNQ